MPCCQQVLGQLLHQLAVFLEDAALDIARM